ncbi:MAG TPA: 16S rRNA (adenine(1518)-N(6)/adenine(1519)-N(6))-dimethyltransferase RsmA [Candidatus Fermentibacter sp.]|nr:16S rRNA (adenine(1518)-N(6)/adenine(1519)-N(6))-dimethyltransferase RsmA [Candidatus Fermentibacter sp.]
MNAVEVRRALDELGMVPNRALGQNFLVNESIAVRIAGACPAGSVLEIGPGLGSLTEFLVSPERPVTAVEVSRLMAARLERIFEGKPLRVVTDDFLEVDPASLPGAPFDALAANLPYGISSPALFRLAEPGFGSIRTAVVMLQAELAARVAAGPGSKEYGRLALGLWPFFEASALLDAEPGDFLPEPAVRSRVLVLRRREAQLVPSALVPAFGRIVAVSFSRRRKTILNNLAAAMGREEAATLLGLAGIDSGLRAEQLPPECFRRMAELGA